MCTACIMAFHASSLLRMHGQILLPRIRYTSELVCLRIEKRWWETNRRVPIVTYQTNMGAQISGYLEATTVFQIDLILSMIMAQMFKSA